MSPRPRVLDPPYRLVVRLADRETDKVAAVAQREAEHDLRVLSGLAKLDLAAVLDDHQGVPCHRLIRDVPVDELVQLEKTAHRNGWALEHSLTSYWVLDTRGYGETPRLVAALQRLDSVVSVKRARIFRRGDRAVASGRRSRKPDRQGGQAVHAYPESGFSDPRVTVGADGTGLAQGYLGPAPLGVDAEYAWEKGFLGEGIRFVDLERTWNFAHADLRHCAAKCEDGNVLFYNHSQDVLGEGGCPEHGTQVLGIVAASHEVGPIHGIAPAASIGTVSRYREPGGELDLPDYNDVAGAIVGAIRPAHGRLSAGDILLLEVQTGRTLLPVEVTEHCQLAIRLAVGNGIVVIEPAGNGGHDLDADTVDTDFEKDVRIHLRRAAGLRDSGAIMVGSCRPEVAATNRNGAEIRGHAPEPSSSYGSRVNCHAWGGSVATTGGDTGVETPCNSRYSTDFGGTSAASAIIAGVAVLTQQMYLDATGGRLTSVEMRDLLSNPELGAPAIQPANSEPRPIGSMPDLRAIAAFLGLD